MAVNHFELTSGFRIVAPLLVGRGSIIVTNASHILKKYFGNI